MDDKSFLNLISDDVLNEIKIDTRLRAPFKRVVKKVSDVKKWSKEQIADIIDNVQVDNDDNIYINYKYAVMEMA